MLTPSHQSSLWHPHSLSCHCLPLCSLCSHSSVQYLQDTGFIHAMGKAVPGHLIKEQVSTQLMTHRPPQWCGYNPNVSHKLGLTASKILALKKLHKGMCTADLRSFCGMWARNQEISSQLTDGNALPQTTTKRAFLTCGLFFCQQNCCYYYYIVM